MKTRRQLLAAMLSTGLAVVLPAGAASKKRKRKVPATRPGHASELPTVAWVKGNRFKVGRKTYVLDDSTEVVVNGEEAGVEALKPGMQVMVSSRLGKLGDGVEDSEYRATRVVARRDNQLEKKAQERARKQRERLKAQSQRRSLNGKK